MQLMVWIATKWCHRFWPLLNLVTSATDLPFQPSYEQDSPLELPMSTVVSLLVLTSMIGIMNNHSLRQRR
ncbi:MAG: hypothetical protein CBB79_01610 [Synechococcus sp. TMED19]|nr:MAG: hypothetical protein CBB79_01610 [Synechococcus sp. TMED19]